MRYLLFGFVLAFAAGCAALGPAPTFLISVGLITKVDPLFQATYVVIAFIFSCLFVILIFLRLKHLLEQRTKIKAIEQVQTNLADKGHKIIIDTSKATRDAAIHVQSSLEKLSLKSDASSMAAASVHDLFLSKIAAARRHQPKSLFSSDDLDALYKGNKKISDRDLERRYEETKLYTELIFSSLKKQCTNAFDAITSAETLLYSQIDPKLPSNANTVLMVNFKLALDQIVALVEGENEPSTPSPQKQTMPSTNSRTVPGTTPNPSTNQGGFPSGSAVTNPAP